MKKTYSPLLFLVIFLTSCAVGRRYDYHLLRAQIESTNKHSLAVVISDQRPYILSGNKQPNFVGLQRGGYGNPFNVTTESNNALSKDFQLAIEESFRNSGTSIKSVSAPAIVDAPQAQELLKSSGAERGLLVELKEWKSDVLIHFSLLYDLKITVFDKRGKELGFESFNGKEVIGSGFIAPASSGEKAVMEHAQRKLTEFLNSKKIRSAL